MCERITDVPSGSHWLIGDENRREGEKGRDRQRGRKERGGREAGGRRRERVINGCVVKKSCSREGLGRKVLSEVAGDTTSATRDQHDLA